MILSPHDREILDWMVRWRDAQITPIPITPPMIAWAAAQVFRRHERTTRIGRRLRRLATLAATLPYQPRSLEIDPKLPETGP